MENKDFKIIAVTAGIITAFLVCIFRVSNII